MLEWDTPHWQWARVWDNGWIAAHATQQLCGARSRIETAEHEQHRVDGKGNRII